MNSTMDVADAVVIGSGPNGLVAGITLEEVAAVEAQVEAERRAQIAANAAARQQPPSVN